MPAAEPNSSQLKPAPLCDWPAKAVQSATALGSRITTATGGAKRSSSHSGWVHTCSFESSVMPKTTSGMTRSEPSR